MKNYDPVILPENGSVSFIAHFAKATSNNKFPSYVSKFIYRTECFQVKNRNAEFLKPVSEQKTLQLY